MKNVKPGHKCPVVLLDPGHHGSKYNPGAVSGYYESERMWQLTMFEKAALEAYGIKVILSRDSINDNPDVVTRGKMAKDADFAESNHTNAGGNGKADHSLSIVFVDDNCSNIDERSRMIGLKLATVCAETVGIKSAPQVVTRKSDYDRDGNGYADDWYGFLRGAHAVGTAAAIVEHVFHDHKASAAWMMSDVNLKKLAEAKAAVLAEYFDVKKPVASSSSSSSGSSGKTSVTTIELRTLRVGDTGPDVKFLQRFLLGYGGKPGAIIKETGGADGKYYSGTKRAVEAFQDENVDEHGKPLEKDGKCGPLTWGAIHGKGR